MCTYNFNHAKCQILIYFNKSVFINNCISDIVLIPSRKHPLLMYKGYTYNRNHTVGRKNIYWKCSKIKYGCKAALRTNLLGNSNKFDILHAYHNHDPPKYHRTEDGRWVKV